MTSFSTVLVANRGEIARRVIRTLSALGIRSVAVYSDADRDAPHVHEADVAVRIGEAAASDSYLNADAVIAAAVQTGADAVHPGYGFLSENAEFAAACAARGIVFIGPRERALQIMGDKIRSKEHVGAHGVRTVPGFSAAGMSDAEIAEAASRTGYPLLIKPSAGGGGKGMQIVREASELREALATARRIAASAFGDDTLLLERLIEKPRHIEVQVLADSHGTVVHLGERECTLQRRHQKVIEEAPSPVVDDATRARLGAAACAAAASVDYLGAGTVEFLVAADRPDDFFFIEMNTRLQVEHPVTELVAGIDLVEQQLLVAAGDALAFGQDDIALTGHAIEARVYAENPARGFLPATGDVLRWQAADGVRTDAAVLTGSAITAHYDPMVAKVIAHAPDRAGALERLDRALAETVLLGVDSNMAFLRALLAEPAVQAGDLDTGLIDRMGTYEAPSPGAAVLRAVVGAMPAERALVGPLWRAQSGWRAAGAPVRAPRRVETADGEVLLVPVDTPTDVAAEVVAAVDAEGWTWVHADGQTFRLRALSRRDASQRARKARAGDAITSDPAVRAPMPGAVVAVHVSDGATVAAGDRLLTIEAMKMEHPVVAPHPGTVDLHAARGEQVRRDQIVAHIHPAEPDAHEASVS